MEYNKVMKTPKIGVPKVKSKVPTVPAPKFTHVKEVKFKPAKIVKK